MWFLCLFRKLPTVLESRPNPPGKSWWGRFSSPVHREGTQRLTTGKKRESCLCAAAPAFSLYCLLVFDISFPSKTHIATQPLHSDKKAKFSKAPNMGSAQFTFLCLLLINRCTHKQAVSRFVIQAYFAISLVICISTLTHTVLTN